MRIIESLKQDIPEKVINQSVSLKKKLDKCSGPDREAMLKKMEAEEENIWICHEAHRRSVAVGASNQNELYGKLNLALRKKQGIKAEWQTEADKIGNDFSKMTRPLITRIIMLADLETQKVLGRRIVRRLVGNRYSDGMPYESNTDAVNEAFNLLGKFKSDISGMSHFSIPEILEAVAACEKDLDKIDLNIFVKGETTEMRFKDMTGNQGSSLPPLYQGVE